MKTQTKIEVTAPGMFTFWDEKIDNFSYLTQEKLVSNFEEWLKIQDKDWLSILTSNSCIKEFLISRKDFLPILSDTQIDEILNTLKPVYCDYCYGKK